MKLKKILATLLLAASLTACITEPVGTAVGVTAEIIEAPFAIAAAIISAPFLAVGAAVEAKREQADNEAGT